jgi:hypothetical protein
LLQNEGRVKKDKTGQSNRVPADGKVEKTEDRRGSRVQGKKSRGNKRSVWSNWVVKRREGVVVLIVKLTQGA